MIVWYRDGYMNQSSNDPWQASALTDAVMERASKELRDILHSLAVNLRPFPGFMGMTTIQAVEADPGAQIAVDKGCVVVAPDGELYQLILRIIPGPSGMGEVDQIEEFKALECSPKEYIFYAFGAIQELIRIQRQL